MSNIAKKLLAKYKQNEVKKGMQVEKEHGSLLSPETNITKNNKDQTAKIVMAHLKELPDYYSRLEKMEDEAKKDNKNNKSYDKI